MKPGERDGEREEATEVGGAFKRGIGLRKAALTAGKYLCQVCITLHKNPEYEFSLTGCR